MASLFSYIRLQSRQFWAGFFTALCLCSVILSTSRWVYNSLSVSTDPSKIYFPCSRPGYPMEGDRSVYHTMQVLPPPAECRVQGFMIEGLEAELNYRRAYTLGYTHAEHDRIQMLSYMRAVQDLSMHARERRVLLDLGSGQFNTSVLWFIRWYPMDFTEIHIFDPTAATTPLLPPKTGISYPELYEQMEVTGNLSHWSQLPLPDWALDRIVVHSDFVTARNSTYAPKGGPGSNITKFILEDLGLTPDDSVVVKMDLEGEEWDILQEWMGIPQMSDIIDEVFVRMYYNHTTMTDFGWNQYENSREDSFRVLSYMRKLGFFVHYLP